MTELEGRVVFLDRDGVINRDSPDYIKTWEEFEFLPGSLEAIAELTRHGCEVMIITNQSVVHRGLTTQQELERMFANMTAAVTARGGRIRHIFYCPHRPDENCTCRKPRPGLFFQARDRFQLDLAATCMVGDSLKDMLAACQAGVGTTVLVQTGNGRGVRPEDMAGQVRIDHVAPDLQAAAAWLLRENG